MALTRQSLLKWARACFPAEAEPLRLADQAAEQRLFLRLKDGGRNVEGLKVSRVSSSHGPSQGWSHLFELSVTDPGRSYGHESFVLALDAERRLFIRVGAYWRRQAPSFPVAEFEQLDRLLLEADEGRRQSILRDAKRDKRAQLRMRALRARVEPMAAQHGLAFALEQGHMGAKLHLEWPGRRFGEFFVPFKHLDEALEEVEQMLAPLTRSAALGVKLKLKPAGSSRQGWLPWVRPSKDSE